MAEVLLDTQLDLADAAADAKLDAEPALNEEAPRKEEAAVPSKPKNLYFVRVPRPQIDEAPVKELQTKLAATLAKLKEYNSKLAAKREVVSGLRSQVAVARSLKEEAAPEWQEKMKRLQELREVRKNILDDISTIKATQSGLDVRSEEELDAKVAAMEAEIAHGAMALREEKQMVRDISRLKAQRERVREAESRHASLSQLEGELVKVKATIKELETEVSSLHGERSQASGILQEIQGKLREVNDAISDLETERGEHEAKKKAQQEQIRTLQDESSEAMQEWRENRKFSLTVRDLVEAGKVDEAREMCEAQVATYLGRILGDKAYRKEYTAGWAEQRKYAVSELLPGSGAAQDVGGRGGGVGGRSDKGAAKGAAAAPRPEPKVAGAAKAAALIEQIMQQAQSVAAAQRPAPPPPPPPAHDEDDAAEPDDAAPDANGGAGATAPDANGGGAYKPPHAGPREVPGATDDLLAAKKPRSKPSGSSAAKAAAELPQLPDLEFEVPKQAAAAAKEDASGLTEDQKKELIREENRRKAAEAAERKKRREEAAARKKQAAEARKAEEPAMPSPAAAAAPAHAHAAAEDDGAAAPVADDDGEAAVSAARPQQQKQGRGQKVQQRKPKGAAVIKPEPIVKRPRGEDPTWKKALKAVKLDNSTNQAVAMCAVLMLLIFIVLLR